MSLIIVIGLAALTQAPGPLRSASQIYFDAAGRRVMLVNAYQGDLPERLQLRTLGAGGWNVVDAAGAPPMRRLSASVYDTRRNRLVIFGGTGHAVRPASPMTLPANVSS